MFRISLSQHWAGWESFSSLIWLTLLTKSQMIILKKKKKREAPCIPKILAQHLRNWHRLRNSHPPIIHENCGILSVSTKIGVFILLVNSGRSLCPSAYFTLSSPREEDWWAWQTKIWTFCLAAFPLYFAIYLLLELVHLVLVFHYRK